MSVSYLDTLVVVDAAGSEGLVYGKISRAMKVHVRSLVAEGIAGSYSPAGEWVSLDTEGCVVCITVQGASYVDMLTEAGVLAAKVAKKAPVRKPKAPVQVVPEALESVAPVTPKIKRVHSKPVQAPVVVSSVTNRLADLQAAMLKSAENIERLEYIIAGLEHLQVQPA